MAGAGGYSNAVMLALAILAAAGAQNPVVPFYERLREYRDGDFWEYVRVNKDGSKTNQKYELHLQLDDGKNRRFRVVLRTDYPSMKGTVPLEPVWESEFVQNIGSREVNAIGQRARVSDATLDPPLGGWSTWGDKRGQVLLPGTWNRETRLSGGYFGVDRGGPPTHVFVKDGVVKSPSMDFDVKLFRYQNENVKSDYWWNTQIGLPVYSEHWWYGDLSTETLTRTNVVVKTK